MKRLALLFMLLAFGFAEGLAVPASPGRVRINTLPVGETLPHSDVNAIVQDQTGYLWFATYGGLCKYDGNRVTTYRTSNSGLTNDRVISLCVSRDSLIYIGTESDGLNVYDPVKDRVNPVYDVMGNLPTIDDVVYSVFEDGSGVVWVCHNNSLSMVSGDAGNKIIRTCYRAETAKETIRAGIALSADSLLFSTSQDLRIYRKSTGDCRVVAERIYNVNSFARDANGNIYFGSYDGVYLFHDCRADKVFDCPAVRSLYAAENGRLFAGTYENGMFEFTRGGQEISHYAPDRISSYEISAICSDTSGLLWIGTIGGGLNTITLRSNNIACYTTSGGLGYNQVLGFTEDSSGYLWVSSHNGGIDIFDRSTGQFRNIDLNGRPSEEFHVVSAFYNDNNGNIWLCTWDGGAYRIDREEIERLHGALSGSERGRISARAARKVWDENISVFKIAEDGKGNMWFSTNMGLYEYDGMNLKSYRHDSMDLSSLYSDYITDIYIDTQTQDRVVWIGTRAGLNRLDFDQDGNPVMHRVSFPSQGNKSVFISVIYRDRQSRLWIATIGNGLYQMTDGIFGEGTPAFVHYTQSNSSLCSNDLESLQEDSDGNLWIGGGTGIMKFNPDSNTVKVYTVKDNLQSNSFKIWASYKTKDGHMVFGGTKGFNIFHPDSILTDNTLNNVVISSVATRKRRIAEGDVLNHKENSVAFEFALLSFNNSVFNQYKYRLKGYEKDFNYTTGENPKAVYSNLWKGRYRFEVYGANSDQVWNGNPATLTFRVRAHPLLSTFACLLYVLFLFFFIYLVYKGLLKRAQERDRVKKQEEKLRYFTDMAHEIKTPLSLISAPVEELLTNYNLGASTRDRLLIVNKSISTLRSIVEQLLDLRKYENNMMKLSVSKIDFCHFLQEIGDLFIPLAKSRKINFKIDIPADTPIYVYCEKHKMERVVVNLLSNAFKFTNADGVVVMKCRADSKNVYLIVEDNGAGIDAKDVPHIFERFYQGGNQDDSTRGGSGIGLALSKFIVEHHRGEINVESRLGFGTKFTVSLPLGSSHFKAEEINEPHKDSSDISNYDPIDESQFSSTNSKDKDITVLVVDDNDSLRQYLLTFLSRRYNVLSASNGMEAYEIAIAEQPDLILSDIVMPEMGGVELCHRIKNNDTTSHIMVILLTARDLALTEIDSWSAGADAFLTKPFSTGVLTSCIENLLSRREKMRAAFQKTIVVKPAEIKVMTSDEKLMNRCLDAVEQHIGDPSFGVEQLSVAVGVSKSQLYRKISAITGLSTIQFIRKIRLRRAAQILSQDSTSVNEVMYMVGFNNLSYFSKLFKEEFGCSPKDYPQM